MKNINENRPRGTRDIFPPLSIIFQKIYEITSEILNKNNFKQVIFPTFEYTKIFENSIGLSTDIVGKEMFTFLSKSGYSLTLRPEGTVCLARLIKQNKLLKTNFPLKFFY